MFIPNQPFSQGCKFIILLSTQCYCVILAYYAEPQITFRTGSDSVTPVIPLSSLYCLCLTDPLFLFLKGSDSNSPVSSLFTLPCINRKQKSHRKAVPTWVSQAINILPRSPRTAGRLPVLSAVGFKTPRHPCGAEKSHSPDRRFHNLRAKLGMCKTYFPCDGTTGVSRCVFINWTIFNLTPRP